MTWLQGEGEIPVPRGVWTVRHEARNELWRSHAPPQHEVAVGDLVFVTQADFCAIGRVAANLDVVQRRVDPLGPVGRGVLPSIGCCAAEGGRV